LGELNLLTEASEATEPIQPTAGATPRLARPLAVKLGADVLGRIALLGLLIVAARTLNEAEFGHYAFAIAVGLIGAQLASGGLQVTLLRRLSISTAAPEDRVAFGAALRARTVAGLAWGAAAGLVAAIAAASVGEAVALAALAASVVVASHGEIWLQVMRATGRLQTEAVAMLAGRLATTFAGVIALLAGTGLAGLAVAHVCGALVAVVLARAISRRVLAPSPQSGWRDVWSWYRQSVPLAVAGVASLLMFRIDVLLLEWLRGPETVGLYATAYRPFEATLLVSVAVMAATFPHLARAASEPAEFRRFGSRVAALLAVLALVVAGLGWLLGPRFVELAFGPRYEAATDLVRLLAVAVLPMYLNALVTHGLIALGRTWHVAVAMAAALAVNVVVNLWLIPGQGAAGAAIATVAAEATLLLVGVLGLSPVRLGARAGRATTA
jgi:O-antigen/teichoic acid export membrane protein